jgi:hypothetical protein
MNRPDRQRLQRSRRGSPINVVAVPLIGSFGGRLAKNQMRIHAARSS